MKMRKKTQILIGTALIVAAGIGSFSTAPADDFCAAPDPEWPYGPPADLSDITIPVGPSFSSAGSNDLRDLVPTSDDQKRDAEESKTKRYNCCLDKPK